MRIAGASGGRMDRHDLGAAETARQRGRIGASDAGRAIIATLPRGFSDRRGAAEPAPRTDPPRRHAPRASARPAWRGPSPSLKGGFISTKSNERSASPAAFARLAGKRDVGDEHAGAPGEVHCCRDAPASAGRNAAISGDCSTRSTRASGQRESDGQACRAGAGAEIGEPARQSRTGTAPPASCASMPARCAPFAGCTSQKSPAVEGVDRIVRLNGHGGIGLSGHASRCRCRRR